ncbi:DsbA family protein [Chryseobacterium sp. ISL-80]|nr:DsbA family protein [Chryseobacterium sp. ISL-80]
MAEFPLKEAIDGKDVELEWMPFELRPYPNKTLKPEEHYLQSTWKQSVYPMAERMGVEIVLPDVSPQPYTHLAFEGYQYAKEQGKGNEYNDHMLKAFFQRGLDIGDVEILTMLAGEVGLDQDEYRHALESRKYKEAHRQALNHAYNEVDITAVPTFIVGDRVVPGMRSKEALEQIILSEMDNPEEGMSCGVDGC